MTTVTLSRDEKKAVALEKAINHPLTKKFKNKERRKMTSSEVSDEQAIAIKTVFEETGLPHRELEEVFRLKDNNGMNCYRCVTLRAPKAIRAAKTVKTRIAKKAETTEAPAPKVKAEKKAVVEKSDAPNNDAKAKRSEQARKAAIASNAAQKIKREAAKLLKVPVAVPIDAPSETAADFSTEPVETTASISAESNDVAVETGETVPETTA